MARKIHSRLKICGTLVTETPLHVGGFGESIDTDLPLAQNGRGEWYVPGTSIAGVLRNWCEKNFEASLVDTLITKLFGPKREKGIEEGHASFVLIEDATIEKADEVLTEIRDGVGIDRYYGVAADKAKFDRAILPRGTKLKFVMTVEVGEDHNASETKAVIGNLLAALAESGVRFGASRTRGLGRVKLIGKKKENDEYEVEPEIKEQSLIGFENMLKLLSGNGETRSVKELKEGASLSTASAPRLEIAITWKPRLPVMVKAGYDGIGVDMLPLASAVNDSEVAFCLPGSSIKGVLRSHAERIIRTVLPDCACAKDKLNFHEQIDALPLVEELFGARNKSDQESSDVKQNKKCKSNPKANLGLGALAIDDCYATETINAEQWGKVEVAADAKEKATEQEKDEEVSYYQRELWKRLREVDEWKAEFTSNKDENNKDKLSINEYRKDSKRFRINHHVAIDRWTGGASEGALYSVLVPIKVKWEQMRLTLDFGRIEEESYLPALMLLLLVLRDVAENHLPFGFATNRGMGEIEVEKIEIVGRGFTDQWKALNEFVPTTSTTSEENKFQTNGRFTELSKGLKNRLSEEWSEWRSKQNQQS